MLVIWDKRLTWSLISAFVCLFSFEICPNETEIIQMKTKNRKAMEEINDLRLRVARARITKKLASQGDPITMERFVREEFRLDRIKEGAAPDAN